MLIVGGGLMASAITVFLLWNAVRKCRELWQARKRSRRTVHREQEPHDT